MCKGLVPRRRRRQQFETVTNKLPGHATNGVTSGAKSFAMAMDDAEPGRRLIEFVGSGIAERWVDNFRLLLIDCV